MKDVKFCILLRDLLLDSSFLITHVAHSYGTYHYAPWNLNLLGCN